METTWRQWRRRRRRLSWTSHPLALLVPIIMITTLATATSTAAAAAAAAANDDDHDGGFASDSASPLSRFDTLDSEIEQLLSRELSDSSNQDEEDHGRETSNRHGDDDEDDDEELKAGWRSRKGATRGERAWSQWSTEVDENQTLSQLVSREESDSTDYDDDDGDDDDDNDVDAESHGGQDEDHGNSNSSLPVFQSCSTGYASAFKGTSLYGLFLNLRSKKKGKSSSRPVSLSSPLNASALDPPRVVRYRDVFNCVSDDVRCPRAGTVELFGEPKSGTTWMQQTMLTLFGLACQLFNPDDPDHIRRLKDLDESQCFYQCWTNRVYFFIPGNATTHPVVYKWEHSSKHSIPTDGKSGRMNAIIFHMDAWIKQCVKKHGKGSGVQWTRQRNCIEMSGWEPTLKYSHHKILLAWRDPRVVMHSGAHYKPQLFFKMGGFSQEKDQLIDTELLPNWLEKTSYENFVSTLMWMYLRNAWFHTGLIGAQVLTVYYESMSLEFRKTLWDIVEYIGLERFVTEADMDKLMAETSLDSMREMEEKGDLIQRKKLDNGTYEPPKVGSGIIWMNQTQVPTQVLDTLDRIMCSVWPLELTLHYLDSCEETDM